MTITLAADTGRAAARRPPIAPAVFDRRDEDGVVVPPDAAPPTQRQDAVRAAPGSPAPVAEVRA
ncbi:ferredoxin [Streptomyces sioyaensis]|uniref:ferredoxin n=1 Tax=Streptomyces sioyaensis TaxID=67364 RepID=UPI0033D1E4F0